jgi:PAS domain S-box-containing protein
MSPRRALPPALYRKFPFLQEVLDGMPAAVKVVDSQFHVVYANAQAREESGYELAALRGRPCFLYINGFHQNCTWCPVVKAMEDGERHVHYFEKEKDGVKRRMEVTGYSLSGGGKGKNYAVEITRDVTSISTGDAFRGGLSFPAAVSAPPPLEETVGEAEKRFLLEALGRARGNMAVAAKEAGFSVKTLQRRLRKYGLDIREFKRIG